MTGFGEQKTSSKKKAKSSQKKQIAGDNLRREAISHHAQGDLINAERKYREAIEIGCQHHSVFMNLGVICKNSGRQKRPLFYTKEQ